MIIIIQLLVLKFNDGRVTRFKTREIDALSLQVPKCQQDVPHKSSRCTPLAQERQEYQQLNLLRLTETIPTEAYSFR